MFARDLHLLVILMHNGHNPLESCRAFRDLRSLRLIDFVLVE